VGGIGVAVRGTSFGDASPGLVLREFGRALRGRLNSAKCRGAGAGDFDAVGVGAIFLAGPAKTQAAGAIIRRGHMFGY